MINIPMFRELAENEDGFVQVGIKRKEQRRIKALQREIKSATGVKLSFYKLVELAVTMFEATKEDVIQHENAEKARLEAYKRARSV